MNANERERFVPYGVGRRTTRLPLAEHIRVGSRSFAVQNCGFAADYPTAASLGGLGRPRPSAMRFWNQATPCSCLGDSTPPW